MEIVKNLEHESDFVSCVHSSNEEKTDKKGERHFLNPGCGHENR